MLLTEQEHSPRLLDICDDQARLEGKLKQAASLRVEVTLALAEVGREWSDTGLAQMRGNLVEEEFLPVDQRHAQHNFQSVLAVVH